MIVFPLDPVRKEASSSPKEWDGLKVGAEGSRGGRERKSKQIDIQHSRKIHPFLNKLFILK